MPIKITPWDDTIAKKNITKKYENAVTARRPYESKWRSSEKAVYQSSNFGDWTEWGFPLEGVDESDADSNAVYLMKNIRFLHAQMSANPPSVAFKPTSSDQEDHRRADAADRWYRWALRKYQLQEHFDQLTLNTLIYGTGFIKVVWDSTKGDIIEFDEETQEMELEGDFNISIPSPFNIFFDPDAKVWQDVKWVVEKLYIDFDEAITRWPDKKEELEAAKQVKEEVFSSKNTANTFNSVELWEYWETGLPSNGYLGRYCIMTPAGSVIEPCRPSPFRFRKAGTTRRILDSDLPDDIIEDKINRLPKQAGLPFHILTDIDVPNSIYGRSAVEYVAILQNNLLRVDVATMDNIQAHGSARLVLPESAEIDQSLSTSPWDVVKISGNQSPHFMETPRLMPEMVSTRMNLIQGINDGFGVNDAMFGVQKRETSGTSMNLATNQGNLIRRRIFNKYVMVVEAVAKSLLSLVVKHWDISRTISVIGKENALESVDLKGADIDGGYDVVGEYGASLSLDPMSRREEIMLLQPLFEKAGVPPRTSLKLMKLNELEGMYDRLTLAGNRQREIFDEMAGSGRYIAPEDLMDHDNMISWALEYFMTSEFQYMESSLKDLCKQHIRDRVQLAAQEKAALSGGGGEAAGTPGAPLPPGPVPELEPPAPDLGALAPLVNQ